MNAQKKRETVIPHPSKTAVSNPAGAAQPQNMNYRAAMIYIFIPSSSKNTRTKRDTNTAGS